ncbi:cell division protein DivIVA [Mycobacterium rhizamassiliense]|uniref:cell division protein DivIVA n=1 Tax=Mycobacterium rhizamassiliense TaxID=1841860 RepID=UPI00097DC5B9|nr:cell division protein DivIVA [Mycobacterium rhizamassiliense]
MLTEPAKAFSRKFMGYDATAVEAHIEMLTTKQNLLLNDVESLRGRLKDAGDEAAGLRKEVAVLADTSPSPHAVQQRMAKMLRRAVDEISEMQAEAKAEAEALIADAEAEAAEARRKRDEVQADMAKQQKAMEAEYQDTKQALEAELTSLRSDAQQAREQLLAEAKQRADRDRDEARRAVDEASQQRIKILEQLMGVYRDLEAVPHALESAYQEHKNPAETDGQAVDRKVSAG